MVAQDMKPIYPCGTHISFFPKHLKKNGLYVIHIIYFPIELTPVSFLPLSFVQSLHQLAWSPILSSFCLQAFLLHTSMKLLVEQ